MTTLRPIHFSWLLALAAPFATGCSAAGDDTQTSDQEVVTIAQGKIKNEAIGNCWLYAAGSWVESVHKASTGEQIDVSETYWSYWDWFLRLTGGEVTGTTLETGGLWERAAWIMQEYGYMNEADFVPADTTSDTQNIQAAALTSIQTALTSGTLKTPASRANGTIVRAALNKAFGLKTKVVTDLTTTFGKDGSRTWANATPGKTSAIKQASSLTTGYEPSVDGKSTTPLTLADYIGTGTQYARTGTYVWQPVTYPADAAGRRQLQIRVQSALNTGWTVLMNWYVDFNALNTQGQFLKPAATPGDQGGHYSVLADYQIDNVPGFGTLPAGVNETRPAALQASLDPSANIEFFRTKNSWGDYQSLPSMPGFYDVYEPYFDGPIQECQTNADETPILSSCVAATPISEFVIPPGF